MAVDVLCVAEQISEDRWRARPWAARVLRCVIVGVPLLAGYAATVLCLHLLRTQVAASKWWLVLAVGASLVVCVGVERLTRRLLPLALLLKLSMLFPDRAPSRFKVARQAVSKHTPRGAVADRPGSAAGSAQEGLALITALTAHDRRTRGHSERVRLFSELLGEQLRLPRDDRDRLRWASLLHDIGKLRVATDILNKPSKLNPTEWELVATHPSNGELLLGPLVGWLGEWGGAVRQHHEKYDGGGYPDGLSGTGICRAARIVSIADSFEVMTAHRAYKKPMATAAARAELARCAGSQFDPVYVRAFLAISLPRLLWAMGPGSLLMNLPFLRTLADSANKGVVATSQSTVLAASAAVVIGGVTATSGGVVTVPSGSAAPVAAIHVVTSRPPPRSSTPRPRVLSPTPTDTPTTPTPDPTGPTTPQPGISTPTPTPLPAVAIRSSVITGSAVTISFDVDPTATVVMCSLDGAAATICAGGVFAATGLPDGVHTVTAWAEDGSGHPGPTTSTTFTIDTIAPIVTITSTPAAVIARSSAAIDFTVDDPSAEVWCSVDGAAATKCADSITVTTLADGSHTVAVYAVDPAGNRGPPASATFTVDTTGPVSSLTVTPPALSNATTATVAFTSDDPSATAWCSLDGAPATVCTGTAVFTGLADGSHTVTVFGVDTLGNVGPPVGATFTVDTTPPVVTISSPPPTQIASTDVSVGFTVHDPDATAWCSLDGAPAQTCASPAVFTGLADGPHTIAIYATDAAGNTSTPIQTSFTVDTTGPVLSLTSTPPAISNAATATITFTSNDLSATGWCSLDGGLAQTCTTAGSATFTNLSDGVHTIDLYGVDPLGNVGPTSSTTFTIDTAPPLITLTSTPAPLIASSDVTVNFTVDDPTATTWCSLDSGTAQVCDSPAVFTGLADGPHTIAIYATDAAGNTSTSIQTSFTVDTTGPVLSLTAGPPLIGNSTSATIAFTSNDPTATSWCSLDGGAATVCTSPTTFTGLSDGTHTVAIHGLDSLGNAGPTTSTTFTVDTLAPVVTPTSTPSGVVPSGSVSIAFTVDDPSATTWCSVDGAPATVCDSPVSLNNLANGSHTIAIYAVDPAGNQSPTASDTFTVNATAPTLTLTSVPAHLTNTTTATVDFTVDDPTATAWCSLDGAAATICTGPITFTNLPDGAHTISVYAVSAASVQGTTVSTAFTVDTQAPAVTITSAPSGTINTTSATVTFTTNDPSATAYCSIDAGTVNQCTSPVTFSNLSQGAHTVAIYAVDPAGNVGAAGQASFTVHINGPVVTLTSTPPPTLASRNFTIQFTVSGPTWQAWCSLDGGNPQMCTQSLSYASLTDGSHTISVYAIDWLGNRGPTTSTTFVVAASAPAFTSKPPATGANTTATFTWTNTPNLTYQYSYNGTTWNTTTTTSSNTTTNLSHGSHTFYLRGVDNQGNHTPTTTYTFQVS